MIDQSLDVGFVDLITIQVIIFNDLNVDALFVSFNVVYLFHNI
jgi:hypothetical protein